MLRDVTAVTPYGFWQYRIGSYQVLRRWLRYRKSGVIGLDEVEHFRTIAAVLQETVELQGKLNESWQS